MLSQTPHAAIVRAFVKKGDRVVHPDYGSATVTKVKRDGTVWIKLGLDGLEGTCSALVLSRVAPVQRWLDASPDDQ